MRIIYIDIDSLRLDHLGCYGYGRDTFPNIDRIAGRGTRFDNYYCADSPCMPSRHNLVTGRFGYNNGVVTHGGAASHLRIAERMYGGPEPSNQLLQRVLRENGVDTIGFSNFAWRHCASWFSLGWSEFHSPNLEFGDEQAHEVSGPVLRWLKPNEGRDNYYLHVNFWDPHCNYYAPREWFDRVSRMPFTADWPTAEVIREHQSFPTPHNSVFTTANRLFRQGHSPTPNMPDAIRNRSDYEHLINGYDAEILYTDHHIGLLLEELDRQGVLDETAVIISADHGEAQGEHGVYKDHYCAHECVHNIPLILSWPGLTPPSPNRQFLYNVDLSATLIELLGGSVPEQYDGVSFADGLQHGRWPNRDHLVWGHGLHSLQRCVRTRDYSLIKTYHDRGFPFEPLALYDMRSDPHQTTNLLHENPAIVSELEGLLAIWIQTQEAKSRRGDPFDIVCREWDEAGVRSMSVPPREL